MSEEGGRRTLDPPLQPGRRLAKRGLKTLLVDLDPQASVTQICLGPEVIDTLPPAKTIVGLISDEFFSSARTLIQGTDIPGVDLIPGSNALARFNHPSPRRRGTCKICSRTP